MPRVHDDGAATCRGLAVKMGWEYYTDTAFADDWQRSMSFATLQTSFYRKRPRPFSALSAVGFAPVDNKGKGKVSAV